MNEHLNQGLNAQLLDAVLCGDTASVRQLLAAGATPNHRDGSSYANAEEKGGDYPMLLLAVLRDDVPTASALLEAGADANARCIDYLSRPRNWMMAMSFNCLGWKYRPNGIKYTGPGLYHARALRFASSAAMAELLLEHGADGTGAHLNYFLRKGEASPELIELLLRASLKAAMQKKEGVIDLPIHMAAAEGHATLLELMLEHGTHADRQDSQGRTALHRAATPEIARLLLAHGADINAADDDYTTPLGAACKAGKNAVAAELRAHGARRLRIPPVCLPALHGQARAGNIRLAKLCLEHGADVNERSEYGATPLFFSKEGEMTDFLLSLGADVNATDEFGSTALQHAHCAQKRLQLLTALGLALDTPIKALPSHLPLHVPSHGTRSTDEK